MVKKKSLSASETRIRLVICFHQAKVSEGNQTESTNLIDAIIDQLDDTIGGRCTSIY